MKSPNLQFPIVFGQSCQGGKGRGGVGWPLLALCVLLQSALAEGLTGTETAEQAAAAGLPATAHTLGAVPDKGVMMRSAEGNSYARVHLTKIDYADPANARSPQTWTFEFDVQPAAQ